jgi:hypothetical protein
LKSPGRWPTKAGAATQGGVKVACDGRGMPGNVLRVVTKSREVGTVNNATPWVLPLAFTTARQR